MLQFILLQHRFRFIAHEITTLNLKTSITKLVLYLTYDVGRCKVSCNHCLMWQEIQRHGWPMLKFNGKLLVGYHSMMLKRWADPPWLLTRWCNWATTKQWTAGSFNIAIRSTSYITSHSAHSCPVRTLYCDGTLLVSERITHVDIQAHNSTTGQKRLSNW